MSSRRTFTSRPYSLTAKRKTNRTRDDARSYLFWKKSSIENTVNAVTLSIKSVENELKSTWPGEHTKEMNQRLNRLLQLKKEYNTMNELLQDELNPKKYHQDESSMYLSAFIDVMNRMKYELVPHRKRNERDFWGKKYDRKHMKAYTKRERKYRSRFKELEAENKQLREDNVFLDVRMAQLDESTSNVQTLQQEKLTLQQEKMELEQELQRMRALLKKKD